MDLRTPRVCRQIAFTHPTRSVITADRVSGTLRVAEQSEFNAFTALRKEADELLIYRDELRARYHAEKRPLADVLEEFRAFCAGADAIVAYNGVAHDFHLIDEEYARCDLEPLLTGPTAARLVDALYLAQALSWRSPPAGGRSARRSAPGVRRLG